MWTDCEGLTAGSADPEEVYVGDHIDDEDDGGDDDHDGDENDDDDDDDYDDDDDVEDAVDVDENTASLNNPGDDVPMPVRRFEARRG